MPDPIQMEMGKAVVEVLLHCSQDSESHFNSLLKAISWPEPVEQWTTAPQHEEVEFCVRHVSLAELLADPAELTRWLETGNSPQAQSWQGIAGRGDRTRLFDYAPPNEKFFVLLRVIICRAPLNLAVSKSGGG